MTTSLTQAQTFSAGLIGYWPFNGNTNDAGPNGFNGVADGPILVIDRNGNSLSAYKFAGSQDKITIPDTSVLDNEGKSISISAWVKPTGTWDHLYRAAIVGKGGWDLNSGYELQVLGDMYVEFDIVRTTVTDPSYTLPLNAYTHLVAVFDDERDTAYIYVNGVLLVSQEVTHSINGGDSPLFIGRRCDGNAYVASFVGDIDEVCIYDRVLTPVEINELFNYQQKMCYETITITDTLVINLNVVGFNPVRYQNDIKIYPNPTSDFITIDFGSNFNTLIGYQIRISNNQGQTVYESAVLQQIETLNLNTLSGKGLYLIYLINDKSNIVDVRKLLIQ
jgi:hypothetical protein